MMSMMNVMALWSFSGLSNNSESVSYDCCSFSADIDCLLNA